MRLLLLLVLGLAGPAAAQEIAQGSSIPFQVVGVSSGTAAPNDYAAAQAVCQADFGSQARPATTVDLINTLDLGAVFPSPELIGAESARLWAVTTPESVQGGTCVFGNAAGNPLVPATLATLDNDFTYNEPGASCSSTGPSKWVCSVPELNLPIVDTPAMGPWVLGAATGLMAVVGLRFYRKSRRRL